ncbi:glycosyltransferase family 2 protein [Clostridium saudiense]|uniref:glycosyltransferase family 2 protein n=1 Tax=Clostridium saudiense TaxID=1414720 RepID=UPI00319E0252
MLISIIIPIYNMEKYLDKCINSVINQTYKNIEILLINDGSTDSSIEICNRYKLRDKRIKVINTDNRGVAEARNIGIELAKGDFIGFVDSDDYIELNMFEKLFDLVNKNQCDMAICGYFIEDERNRIIKVGDPKNEVNIFNTEEAMKALINNGNYTSFPVDKLYRKSLFNDIKYPKGKIYEDADTTYKLIHKCKRVIYDPEPLYHYVQRSNSISHSFRPEMMYRLEIDKNLTEFIKVNYPMLIKDVYPIWYRTNIQLLISMYLSKYEDDELYKYIIDNIRKNIVYILKERNIINYKEKIIAVSSCISFNMMKEVLYIINKVRHI